jgi:hypothetical protein
MTLETPVVRIDHLIRSTDRHSRSLSRALSVDDEMAVLGLPVRVRSLVRGNSFNESALFDMSVRTVLVNE